MVMGVGSEARGGPWPPCIFIHGTDKVEGGLMVLFFGFVFSVGLPLEIFLPTPLVMMMFIWRKNTLSFTGALGTCLGLE